MVMYEKNYDARVSEIRFFPLFGSFILFIFLCVRVLYIIVIRIHYSSTTGVL